MGQLIVFGAETWGFLASWVGAELVIFSVKEKAWFRKWPVYCLVFGPLITLYFAAHELVVHAYGAGFEKAVSSAASPAQWESILVNADQTEGPGDDHMLPSFVRKVYPEGEIEQFCDVVLPKTQY